MRLGILKLTANGNLLLRGYEKPIAEKTAIKLRGKQIGFIVDTIGKVEEPFFLARLTEKIEPEKLIGMEVEF